MFEQMLTNPEQITFAALFVGLLIYVMKTNDQREKQYRETINRLTSALVTLENIEKKIDMLHGEMTGRKEAV